MNARENRYSWKKMFVEIAKVVAQRSADPHTQVGAGYNGEPKGFHFDFDWNSPEKYPYVIHAEMNAISNANRNGVDCSGADIYLTLSPCHDCIKLLIQHGIKNVYYLKEYKDIDLTKKIVENTDGIRLIKLDENDL